MNAGRGAPIVVFGDDWGRHVSTMQHVFRHIVPHRRVFWVNAIGHRYPRFTPNDLRRAWDKVGRMFGPRSAPSPSIATMGPRPEVIIEPRVLPWHHWPSVQAFNTRSLVRAIRTALELHECPDRPIIVTGSPPSVGVLGQLGEIGSVYFCMDDFLELPEVSADMIAPLERRLLQRVDVLVATASSLTASKAPASGKTYHLPQGVNYAHFATPRPAAPDIDRLPRPRIGFAGGLSERCDLELLQSLALSFPQGSIVLVGPVLLGGKALSALTAPNVHFLGAKPYAELPAYVQAFDVGIIPYILSDWTRAVDPLKLLEYLAAGVPVVTTALPEAVKYRSHVHIAGDNSGFVREVRLALDTLGPEAKASRMAMASQHTWERRAASLTAILEELEANSARAAVGHR
jgi:glycosyltransferase involved in cell wall biosynthesis